MTNRKHIYKIQFQNRDQLYEIYARHLGQSTLFGFIEVEQLIFGERSKVVVDPSEEKLKSEFSGVKRTWIPMHAIIRIDEVAQEGAGKITTVKGGATVTPLPIYTPEPSKES